MNIQFDKKNDLTATIRLEISQNDYLPKLKEIEGKYAKKVQLKGFRSGKTPKSVLSKMYGKNMLEEAVMTLLQDSLYGYLDENKIDYFGSPMIQAETEQLIFDLKNLSDYTFTFDLGLKPEIDLNLSTDQTVEILKPAVDRAAIEKNLIQYRRVFGDSEKITDGSVEQDDQVVCLVKRKDGTGEESFATLDLARTTGNANLVLLGKTIGDTLEADLTELTGYSREQVLKQLLGGKEDENPDSPLVYNVTIQGINRPQRTELTGEQISKYVGREIENEQAFLDLMIEEESREMEGRVLDYKKMMLRKRVTESNPFDLPEEFLLRWVNDQRKDEIKPGSRQADDFFRDARWSFLLNLISGKENLEVTDRDVQQQVYSWVMRNAQHQLKDFRKLLDQLYANEYFMSSMKESALEEVVFKHLLPLYTYNETEVELKAFDDKAHYLYHEVFGMGDHDHGPLDEHDHSEEGHEHSHA